MISQLMNWHKWCVALDSCHCKLNIFWVWTVRQKKQTVAKRRCHLMLCLWWRFFTVTFQKSKRETDRWWKAAVLVSPCTGVTLTNTVTVTIRQWRTRDICFRPEEEAAVSMHLFSTNSLSSLRSMLCLRSESASTRQNWPLNAETKSMFGMSGYRGWEKTEGGKSPSMCTLVISS